MLLLDVLVMRTYTLVTVTICSRGLVVEQGGLQDTNTLATIYTLIVQQ